jgi:hypothetical protein
MHIRGSVRALAFVVASLHPGLLMAESPQAPAAGQGGTQAAAPGANTHVYRVSAFRAAPGQTTNLEKLLTSAPSPGAGAGDFAVVFRHRQGHEWDYMTVEHMGEQATIDLRTGPAAPPDSPLSQSIAWHGDTYAAGPPLDAFRKALNPQGGQAGANAAIYVISDYMAAAGHRGQLRQVLGTIAEETPGRSVTLSHVEGAPWNFLVITRYDSWRQFAEEEEASAAQAAKSPGAGNPGLALREHLAVHHDTFATVQAVSGSAAR